VPSACSETLGAEVVWWPGLPGERPVIRLCPAVGHWAAPPDGGGSGGGGETPGLGGGVGTEPRRRHTGPD